MNKVNEINFSRKKVYQRDSPLEIFLGIIILIAFISAIIYFFFINVPEQPKIDLYANDRKEMEQQEKENKKHKLNEVKKVNCEEGYFMPTDAKKNKCRKCSVENCSECSGSRSKNICLKCKSLYAATYDKKKRIKTCEKICEVGDKEKCLKCEKNECIKCNSGYKLKDGKCILDADNHKNKIKKNN